jgi:hypothetical protein
MIPCPPIALAAIATLFSVASAQLQILSPGGSNQWWVADTSNLLSWTCQQSQVQNFTVLYVTPVLSALLVIVKGIFSVANPDMASPLAIIAQQENFDCTLTVTQNQMGGLSAGNGYTVQFANILNSTDIYTQSSVFEIKPAGSLFPSTTSSEIATSTSAGSASASSSSSKNGASSPLKASMGYGTAFAVAIAGMFLL